MIWLLYMKIFAKRWQSSLNQNGLLTISHAGDNQGAASIAEHKIKLSTERRLLKMEYERIKEKVKAIRQDIEKL